MGREINTVSCNINDVSVKMTVKLDNVTANMTKKFKDVDIKFDNACCKIDGFKGAVAVLSQAATGLQMDMTEHKATVNKCSDKVSWLEVKVQQHKDKADRIADKINTNHIK